MLLQTLGSNAEAANEFSVTGNIKRIAIPNPKRQAGLIVNRSTADCWIEFGAFPNRLINAPLTSIRIPAKGGNLDIPANYTGAFWVRWRNYRAIGTLAIYHYYLKTSCK